MGALSNTRDASLWPMATHSEMVLPSTRTRAQGAPAILSRSGGVFAGFVLLIVGSLWFLDSAGVIDLGPRFGVIMPPLLVMLAGLYLLVAKLVRR
jgi:hypothetical protein